MPLTTTEESNSLFSSKFGYWTIATLTIFVPLVFGLIKTLFGTFSIQVAMKRIKRSNQLRKEYENLFEARENLMYHISWFKSRGEIQEAKALVKDLIEVDKKLDKIEYEYKGVFNGKLDGDVESKGL